MTERSQPILSKDARLCRILTRHLTILAEIWRDRWQPAGNGTRLLTCRRGLGRCTRRCDRGPPAAAVDHSPHLNCDARYPRRSSRHLARFIRVCVMFEEIVAVVHSIGVTVMKILPISIVLGAGLCGAELFLVLQSGPALVAQARARHRSLLLVHHSAVRALSAHRPSGARRRLAVRHHHRRRAGRVLRQRPRAAGAIAAVAAGGDLPGRLGLHDVLDPPRLPSSGDVEVPRGASFLRGARLDLGGALPSGQHLPRQRR